MQNTKTFPKICSGAPTVQILYFRVCFQFRGQAPEISRSISRTGPRNSAGNTVMTSDESWGRHMNAPVLRLEMKWVVLRPTSIYSMEIIWPITLTGAKGITSEGLHRFPYLTPCKSRAPKRQLLFNEGVLCPSR